MDLVIVGGGIGGVICLKYATAARLSTILLERKDGVGGIWRDLPSWQDIQFRKEDWTLGDLPIAGEDQASILGNIQSWVDRFDLASSIRCNAEVTSARWVGDAWEIVAGGEIYRCRYLIAATGGHNRPVVPRIKRLQSAIQEYHSSALADPGELSGRDVVVVGGGASAYDLLDLCFSHNAQRVVWIYRSLRWMRPTRKAKYFGTDMRELGKRQMLGASVARLNRAIDEDLRRRYRKAGIAEILPEQGFDLRRHQLIPGRRGMIASFDRIERHRGEVSRIEGRTVVISDGQATGCDLVLWGTGYDVDLGYLQVGALSDVHRLDQLASHCGTLFLSLDAPNLFFLAPAVLETSTSTPWAYAHAARSIVSHVAGHTVFGPTRVEGNVNHYDLVKYLARRDRASFPPGLWYLRYLRTALWHPKERPMPIP